MLCSVPPCSLFCSFPRPIPFFAHTFAPLFTQVKANFALPEPEIEYSTESHRSLVGMGKSSAKLSSYWSCLVCEFFSDIRSS